MQPGIRCIDVLCDQNYNGIEYDGFGNSIDGCHQSKLTMKARTKMKNVAIDWTHKALVSHTARLIPPPKSKPELCATTSLLAVLGSVDEFGHNFMRRVGGPRYAKLQRYYSAFCEVPVSALEKSRGTESKSLIDNKPPWGKHDRPDGIIVVSRNKEWKALVEVKTGQDVLEADQIAAYHQIALAYDFDAVITISNETGSRTGEPPTSALAQIKPAQLRKIPVHHIQWRDLLGDGMALHAKHLEQNVEDEDQNWILGEWLRHIHDERSQILIPARLGDGWNEVLQLTKKRLLSTDSKELIDVADNWGNMAREVEFQMRMAGIRLEPRLSRKAKEDLDFRRSEIIKEATEERSLSFSWKTPPPVQNFNCTVDLDARVIRYFFEVDTFAGKSAAARVMCWASQIETKKASEVVVRPKWKKPAIETPIVLSDLKGVRPLNEFLKSKGIETTSGKPTRLKFEWHKSLSGKSGRGGQAHLEQILEGVHEFYSEVMAGLRAVDTLPQDVSSSRKKESMDSSNSEQDSGAPQGGNESSSSPE